MARAAMGCGRGTGDRATALDASVQQFGVSEAEKQDALSALECEINEGEQAIVMTEAALSCSTRDVACSDARLRINTDEFAKSGVALSCGTRDVACSDARLSMNTEGFAKNEAALSCSTRDVARSDARLSMNTDGFAENEAALSCSTRDVAYSDAQRSMDRDGFAKDEAHCDTERSSAGSGSDLRTEARPEQSPPTAPVKGGAPRRERPELRADPRGQGLHRPKGHGDHAVLLHGEPAHERERPVGPVVREHPQHGLWNHLGLDHGRGAPHDGLAYGWEVEPCSQDGVGRGLSRSRQRRDHDTSEYTSGSDGPRLRRGARAAALDKQAMSMSEAALTCSTRDVAYCDAQLSMNRDRFAENEAHCDTVRTYDMQAGVNIPVAGLSGGSSQFLGNIYLPIVGAGGGDNSGMPSDGDLEAMRAAMRAAFGPYDVQARVGNP